MTTCWNKPLSTLLCYAILYCTFHSYFDTPCHPATDNITVQAVEIINYSVDCTIYVNAGASPDIIKNDALKRINHYADEQKKIGATIEPSYIGHLLHSAGAVQYNLPFERIVCSKSQAPVLTELNINVALL